MSYKNERSDLPCEVCNRIVQTIECGFGAKEYLDVFKEKKNPKFKYYRLCGTDQQLVYRFRKNSGLEIEALVQKAKEYRKNHFIKENV